MRLVLTSPNGSTRTVPAAPHLRIETARRGHTAVTLSMETAKLSELGVIAAAIEIGGGVALAPVPVAGGPNSLTESVLALAIGPLRATDMATVDRAGGTVSKVWSLNKMINVVPPAAGKDRSQRAACSSAVCRLLWAKPHRTEWPPTNRTSTPAGTAVWSTSAPFLCDPVCSASMTG